jgi:hypothetical protein
MEGLAAQSSITNYVLYERCLNNVKHSQRQNCAEGEIKILRFTPRNSITSKEWEFNLMEREKFRHEEKSSEIDKRRCCGNMTSSEASAVQELPVLLLYSAEQAVIIPSHKPNHCTKLKNAVT